jgi:hypothetical protein
VVTVHDEALDGIKVALRRYAIDVAGLLIQADARTTAVVEEIAGRRRRLSAKVTALQQLPLQPARDATGSRQLDDATNDLRALDGALRLAEDARARLTATQRLVAVSLQPGVAAAEAELRRKSGALSRFVASAPTVGTTGTSPVTGLDAMAPSKLGGLDQVDLSRVDYTDNPVVGAFGKGGATLTDYRWAVETWESVVRPGVEEQNLTRDDFAERDQDREAPPLRRTADVYDLFLGDSSQIVLSQRADGSLDVINGRHRIEAARQLGIEHLPGRILG